MGNWLAKFDRRSRLLSEANSPYYNRRVYVLSRHLAAAGASFEGDLLKVRLDDG